MKKLLQGSGAFLFLLALLALFVGCAWKEMPSQAFSEGDSASESFVPTEMPTNAPTVAPTEEPTVAPTEAPTIAPTEEPTVAPVDPALKEFESLDFGGESFNILLSSYTYDYMPLDITPYIEGNDRTGADPVKNAIYERNDLVSETINVQPHYIYTPMSSHDYYLAYNRLLAPPTEEAADLYVLNAITLMRFQYNSGKFFQNVLSEDATTYFDFTADGWYKDYMNAFNFASEDKLYLLAGAYFTDVFLSLNLMAVNLDAFDAAFPGGDSAYPEYGLGRDLLLNTVKEGEWTVDRMIAMAEASVDPQGIRTGLLVYDGGLSVNGILPSSGVTYYEITNGGKSYTVRQSSHAENAITAWQNAFSSSATLLMVSTENEPKTYTDFRQTFVDGNALFATGYQPMNFLGDAAMERKGDVCLIPYPKITADGDYCVVTSDDVRIGAIARKTTHLQAISAFLQGCTVSSSGIYKEMVNELYRREDGVDEDCVSMMRVVSDAFAPPYYIMEKTMLIATSNTFYASTLHDPLDKINITHMRTNGYPIYYTTARSRLGLALQQWRYKFDNFK